MWVVFQFTFTVGDPLIGWIEDFFEFLGGATGPWLEGIGVSSLISSLVVDGIIAGVGSVLVFFPIYSCCSLPFPYWKTADTWLVRRILWTGSCIPWAYTESPLFHSSSVLGAMFLQSWLPGRWKTRGTG